MQCAVCFMPYMWVLVVTRDTPIFVNIQYCVSPILAKITGSDIWEGKMYNLIRCISLNSTNYA